MTALPEGWRIGPGYEREDERTSMAFGPMGEEVWISNGHVATTCTDSVPLVVIMALAPGWAPPGDGTPRPLTADDLAAIERDLKRDDVPSDAQGDDWYRLTIRHLVAEVRRLAAMQVPTALGSQAWVDAVVADATMPVAARVSLITATADERERWLMALLAIHGRSRPVETEDGTCATCGEPYDLDGRQPAVHGMCWMCATSALDEVGRIVRAALAFKP